MEVPGEGGCNRGWGDEGKAFTLQNVPLAGYKRQGLLNCVGNRLASPRANEIEVAPNIWCFTLT